MMRIAQASAGLERQIRIQSWIIGVVGLILICTDIAALVAR